MRKAFVLMTALPPTKGHLNLIKYASWLMDNHGPGYGSCGRVTVIVCTQPSEPYADARFYSLRQATRKFGNVDVRRLHQEMEQNPQAEGFWPMWADIMTSFGAEAGDFVVASEPYGKAVADLFGGVFIPYDMERGFTPVRATDVRINAYSSFADILPEFQKYLLTTVTIFGAESTGKTTLAKHLTEPLMRSRFVFEYARPMLEATAPDINVPVMERIWKGQLALQNHVREDLDDIPIIIQDTDLFSTVGYWMQPHWEKDLGSVPQELIDDAYRTISDLYIILKSNIPFEEDPIRYGGDKRESSDEFWENVAKTFNLPYVVIDSADEYDRFNEAARLVQQVARPKIESLYYERSHND